MSDVNPNEQDELNNLENLHDDADIIIEGEDETLVDDIIISDVNVIETEEPKEEEESKHKIKGKHSLGYDSIFKGKKKDDGSEDDEFATDLLVPKQESFDFDVSSSYHDETSDPIEYARQKELKESIYKIITNKTDINIKTSRRKPGRIDFNKYYQILTENLDTSKFSYAEIFVDLSYYFSDNIFNMFKLLDKKWGGKIIKELAKKRNIKLDQIDFL